MLNQDGTPKLDDEGKTIQVYDNEDIMSFARGWTGFQRFIARGNIESRDNTNTEIGVFTQMLKNVVASGNGVSTKPWFQPSVHGAMSAAPGDLHQPFEMKVADRLEAAMGLKTATDKFRVFKEASPLGGGAGAVEPPDDKPMRHYEHVITDGFDAREVSYRRAPEDMIRLLDMLFNLILFT